MTPQEVDYALHRLNDRLKRVEVLLKLRRPEVSQTTEEPHQTPAVPPREEPAPSPNAETTARPSPSRESVAASYTAPDVPERRPGNWLGVMAIICFVVAAGFIIKLTIESGWLTPPRQIALAALLGLSLIGAGFALRKTDQEYASLLPAGGIIILYLTTYAAHSFYHLVSFDTGIAAVSVVSILCIWLYTRMRHDIYVITAAVGSYLSPLALLYTGDAVFTLTYLLCCSTAFAVISIWLRTRTMTLISAYLALFITGYMGQNLHQDGLVASLLGLHFLVFAVGTWLYTVQNRTPLSETEAWAALPVLLGFYALEYLFLDRIQPQLAPWVVLACAALLGLLYVTARKYMADSPASRSLVLIFMTLALVHALYLQILPGMAHPWLVPFILLAISFTPLRDLVPRATGAYVIPLVALLLILAIEYLTMLYQLVLGDDPNRLAAAFATLGCLWVMILRSNRALKADDAWTYCVLGVTHLLAVLACYRLGATIGSLAVSATWLMYAVAVIVLAFARRDEVMAKSAMVVLGLAAGKALLYDAAAAPTGVRIVCLLLTGVVLYGCGLMMRKISTWPKP